MRVIDDYITKDCPKGNAVIFFCPGCGSHKLINLTQAGPIRDDQGRTPVWTWNGSWDKPTIRASVLSGSGTDRQCHLYVTDGQIHYLPDSRHALSGQTVPMHELSW